MNKWRDDKVWARFSFGRAVFWAVMIPAAVLMDWIYSVAFIAVCSIYANLAGDIAAWRADSSPTLERIEKKLDKILKLLEEGRA